MDIRQEIMKILDANFGLTERGTKLQGVADRIVKSLQSRLAECERERDEYKRILDIAITVINESVPMPWHTDPKAIQDCINEIREFKQSLKSENNG